MIKLRQLYEFSFKKVGPLTHQFVIGPEGNYYPISEKMKYHGDVIFLYPSLLQEIKVKIINGFKKQRKQITEKEIDNILKALARNGSDSLFDFLGKKGFIRGGKSTKGIWLSVHTKNKSQDALMTVLQLYKKYDIDQIFVYLTNPAGVEKEKIFYSIDDFIEDLL